MGLFLEMTYLQGPAKTGSWNLCSLSSTIDILQKQELERIFLRWPPRPQVDFEVKSYHKALSPTGYYSSPWKPIWKAKVPRKINCATWTTIEGKILTMDNLRVQGLFVVDWCSMCKQSGESGDHLLLHCCFVYDIWSMVFGMFW